MPKKPTWEQSVRKTFRELQSQREIVRTEINGRPFVIHPDVFPAHIFYESVWFAEQVAKLVGTNSLLEIGTGTGLIALSAALAGSEVTAVDINEKAIANARANFEANDTTGLFYVGHIYDELPLGTRYDFIFWNHPFNRGSEEETDVFMKSVFDFEYRDLEEYIAKAHEHLTLNGRLLLGTGSITDISAIETIAGKYGYESTLLEKIDSPSEVDDSILNDYRIYEFVQILNHTKSA